MIWMACHLCGVPHMLSNREWQEHLAEAKVLYFEERRAPSFNLIRRSK